MKRCRILSFGLAFSIATTLAAFAAGVSGQASAHLSAAPPQRPRVSISISQPKYGYNVVPGSVRRIYATVTGGTSGEDSSPDRPSVRATMTAAAITLRVMKSISASSFIFRPFTNRLCI